HPGRACGDRWGRLERSASPASPSVRYRRHHRYTVVRLSCSPSATSRTGSPISSRRTISHRPVGVNRASLCMVTEPSGEWVGGFATPSFAHYGSVNNLLIIYTYPSRMLDDTVVIVYGQYDP